MNDSKLMATVVGSAPGVRSLPSIPLRPPAQLVACQAPVAGSAPSFQLTFRRGLVTPMTAAHAPEQPGLAPPSSNSIAGPNRLACVHITSEIQYGLSLHYDQVWNLTELRLGDLSSTIGLAPAEQLTLELFSSQRRLLEQDTVDSAEMLTSTESTTLDKEVMNVARTASKTENWRVDGSGSISLGNIFSLGLSGGGSGSVMNSSQYSLQRIHEATTKSAQSLKTLHKVEVRSVTETLVTNRSTRTLTNPYNDRTLLVKVFQLLKEFAVRTSLTDVYGAIVVRITAITFDREFLFAHSGFLRERLLEPALVDDLELATQTPTLDALGAIAAELTTAARLALDSLFERAFVFDLPPQTRPDGTQADVNVPRSSFSTQYIATDPRTSALDDAINGDVPEFAHIFASANLFFRVYDGMTSEQRNANAIALAVALADDVTPRWERVVSDAVNGGSRLREIMDYSHPTEVFRRIPGFLALVNSAVKPRLPALEQATSDDMTLREARLRSDLAARRLLTHLTCNRNYYLQQFLRYESRKTLNQTISDFAAEVLARLPPGLQEVFDLDRTFVDRECIVIPGRYQLSEAAVQAIDKDFMLTQELSGDVEVPADGVALEAVAGSCLLDGVATSTVNASLSLESANIQLSTRQPATTTP